MFPFHSLLDGHIQTPLWFGRSLAQCLTHTLSHDLSYLSCSAHAAARLLGSRSVCSRSVCSRSVCSCSLTPSRPPALTVRSVSSQISHMRRISVLLSHALIARLAPSRGFPCSCALRCTLSLSCSLLLPALKSNPAREPARDRPEVQQYAFYSPQRLHTRAEI